ncbi:MULTISPECIES: cell division protein SepF [Isoptericola]|uniref:Cell division protein SepF n=1 Tax=Isoptericola sediminis TaxID=2733572 RepID=A0A849K6X2_9MICO|nr:MULTISPECIES: cell division protein SepF [Isoptericola]MDO8144673.1 cell division protein SepF [Isoptericola sp. 178]MDO8148519.1 cell division protein SepF [Isoptericola sp. b515]MDO8151998.1 cell division protein SepF [Isoptericola sp. b408]NNU28190.1 cell division protein SepF [Isoptericola sediminis]
MGGALRKTMLYLGLADDQRPDGDYLDEYDEELEPVRDDDYQAEVTPLHRDGVPADALVGADLRRITTIHPRSYNDARLIGEAFRGGTPVIMNLSDMDDSDAKRLVDFSAGLIFGLRGSIERVTNKVFLLSPEHVEITGEEQVAPRPTEARAGAFYNQS